LVPDSEWGVNHKNGQRPPHSIYRSQHELWILFIQAQRHWRHSHAGHFEAFDDSGFAAALSAKRRVVVPEDYELLEDMLNEQRYIVNERVNEAIRSA
jgi:hypothetical protein